MYESVEYIQNLADQPLALWIEPWAVGLYVPSHKSFKLVAVGEHQGKLEIQRDEKKIVVYAWTSSTLSVFMDDKEVQKFSVPVPAIPAGMSMKGFMHMMFGPSPNPDHKSEPVKSRPWWKFW